MRGAAGRRLVGRAVRLARRIALLERRRVLLPRLVPLLDQWKAVHVPMSVVLAVVASVHVALALGGR
jgi:hypothetical protein